MKMRFVGIEEVDQIFGCGHYYQVGNGDLVPMLEKQLVKPVNRYDDVPIGFHIVVFDMSSGSSKIMR